MKLIIITLLAFVFTTALPLDEPSAKERRCINATRSPNINRERMQSISKWYFPIWSKLELYRTAVDVLEKPMATIPPEVLESACYSCNAKFQYSGFNHTAIEYNFTRQENGGVTFKANTANARQGTRLLTLTDNKNFGIGVTCWDDDEASYGVWAPKAKLSDEDKGAIISHLLQLGFEPDFLVETHYDGCPTEDVNKKKTER